jgi:serine/threonine protein kinase
MAHLSDPTLREVMEDGELDGQVIKGMLRDVCNTLEYLHRSGITHRNISPDTIILAEAGAVLVDLSALPSEQTFTGDIRYKWGGVNEDGWSPYADLYGLAVTTLEALTGEYPLTPDGDFADKRYSFSGNPKLETIFKAALAIIRSGPTNIDGHYLTLFDLADESEKITELPSALVTQFNISKGYMTFLVLDMINDPRPRSRNQWVLGALRSRNIPGNKTNKGSMSATVSRLKSAGIAEDHGKKVRLSAEFQDAVKQLLSLGTSFKS